MVVPRFGEPPAAGLLRQEFVRARSGDLDLLAELEAKDRAARESAPSVRPERAVPGTYSQAPPRLIWLDTTDPGQVVLEVRAEDRVGMLCRLAGVFEDLGADVRWATVTTIGSTVVDSFCVDLSTAGTRASRERLEQALLAVLPTPEPKKPPRRRELTRDPGSPAVCRSAGRPHPRLRVDRSGYPGAQYCPCSRQTAGAHSVFESLSDRLTGVLKDLRGKGRLSDADIDATCREIRLALLDADVALPVVRSFIKKIKERAKGAEVHGALNPAQQVVKIVNDELVGILGGETRRLQFAKTPPTVIMLAGLQGAGKTTLAGKLARWLKDQGHTPMLVACDLQRPGAVTQLQVVGERAGVSVFAPHPGTSIGGGENELGVTAADPIAVAQQGIAEAKNKQYDVVVVDTAGRLGIDQELMAQAAGIRDAVQPDETLFVLDAMIGQDAVSTAEAFREGVGFTGVVLTKLDGDARGGAALSVRELTGRPILFASTGEKLEDFDVFHPERMASRILGMGDVLTLIEQAEQHFDATQAEATAAKIGSGELTLEDFLEQMMAVRKMGPIANLLGMLPGAGQMKDALAGVDEKQLDRIQAIIRGMTPAERANPKIINGSRRLRIANGSGVKVSDVNQLVDRFFEARKMMSAMAGQMGMPGARRNQRSKKGKKGKKGGRGPTPPKVRGGLPGGMPAGFPGLGAGMPDLSNMPKGLDEVPPGLEGFDLSKLKFPKN